MHSPRMQELQFERAEQDEVRPVEGEDASPDGGSASAGHPPCALCRGENYANYYTVNDRTVCAGCGAQLAAGPPGTRSVRLARAFAFGAGASLLGGLIWYAITAITGYELGLVAIAIGVGVGQAVRHGSGGVGGIGYMALAVWLTYSGITMTYVPQVLEGFASAASAEVSESGDSLGAPPSVGASDVVPESSGEAGASEGAGVVGLIIAIPFAFFVPLITLVTDPGSGVMGIIILGIALWYAAKVNRKIPLVVEGPFAAA